MKQIKQLRYCGDNPNVVNEPYGLTKENLISGFAFADYLPILSLRIEGEIGTIFYINVNPYPIQMFKPVFDLNFENYGLKLDTLQFKEETLSKYNETNPLIISVIYNDQLGL